MVDGSWRSVGRDLPSRHEGEALLLGIRRGGRLSLLGGLLGLGRSLLLSLFGRLLLGLGGRSGLGLRGGFGGVNEVDPYLVALLFAFLAARAIFHDELLVRSADRIR